MNKSDDSSLYSTSVTRDDIEFLDDGSVAIRSTALLNTLVQSPTHAIKKLAEKLTWITVADITVDNAGRIIVDNSEFRAALQRSLDGPGPADTNTVCKNAYKCAAQ